MNHYRALSLLGLPIVIGQAGVIVLVLQINFTNALRGISDVKPMMLIAFVSYFVISLPAGYLCGFVFGWGWQVSGWHSRSG